MSISISFSVQERSIVKWYEVKHVEVVLDCGLCSGVILELGVTGVVVW